MTDFEIGPTYSHTATQVAGSQLAPDEFDLFALVASLSVGDAVPPGWRVITGNMHASQVCAMATRGEILELFEEESE